MTTKPALNGTDRDCAHAKTLRSISLSVELWIHDLILPWNKHLTLCRTKNDLQFICNAYLFNKVKIYIKCCAVYDN